MKVFKLFNFFKKNNNSDFENLFKCIENEIEKINKDITIHEKYNCNEHLKNDALKKNLLNTILENFNEMKEN